MAGATQTIQRAWLKIAAGAAGYPLDPFYAVFTQLNNVIADVESVRQEALTYLFQSAGLRIHGGSASTLAQGQTAARFYTPNVAGGAVQLGITTANVDMPALAGTVNNAQFGGWVFTVSDAAGTLTYHSRVITPATTREAVVFPSVPNNEVVLGFVEINPTGTGNFVGGTTNLDDATVVPNAVFVNTLGTILMGGAATAGTSTPTVPSTGLAAALLTDEDVS